VHDSGAIDLAGSQSRAVGKRWDTHPLVHRYAGYTPAFALSFRRVSDTTGSMGDKGAWSLLRGLPIEICSISGSVPHPE